MNKKKRIFRRRYVPLLILLILLLVFLYYWIGSLFLRVANYTVEATGISTPIRIVQLTDLHNAEFGENNRKLIEKVSEQKPDVIFMTGDMLNEDDENIDVVVNLVTELSKIAPVYYGYGNHETVWEQNFRKDLHVILGAAGAVVLECEYADAEINGNVIRIGGYMGYWTQPHMTARTAAQIKADYQFYSDFRSKDLPNGNETCRILLNHIPTGWLDWGYINDYDTGVIFSGHYHGGMIRIPIIDQGVAAPYAGWWPPYTKGVFVGKKSTCVLSAGLGLYNGIPRLNNPPEIVVVDLIPAS